MARALVLLPRELAHVVVAGRALSDHWTWIGQRADLPVRTAPFEEPIGEDTPVIVIDGRHAALEPDTLKILAARLEEGAVLLSPAGEVIAAALPAPEPDQPAGEALQSATARVEAVVSPLEAFAVDAAPDASERAIRRRWADTLTAGGARFLDPLRTWVDTTVRVDAGAIVWPDVVLRGATHLAAGAEVQSGAWLEDTDVGPGAIVRPYSVCEGGAVVGPGARVGPFAHLRAGAVLEADTRVGNFVEVKQATLRQGAKASHLTYLGDAVVGAGANVGAGTITCNYDGFGKYRTTIGERAFIGSNSALVAPVTVGDDAIVGAGSVVTRDVPPDALYLERAESQILEGKAPRVRARNKRRAEDEG